MQASHPYDALTPDTVLDAVESAGFMPTGTLLALNSYENRVYQIGEEDLGFIVGKFYRPARWSDAQIQEEHDFARQLAELEIPVVAPLADARGNTLHQFGGFRFALFPRRGGRSPELDDPDTLYRLGQFIGRIHAVGASRPFLHRPAISLQEFGRDALDYLLQQQMLPPHYRGEYQQMAEQILEQVASQLARIDYPSIRLHGDMHPGNILWTEHGAHLVDLDDARSGPAIQDLWMMLGGDAQNMRLQLDELLAGYEEFHDFDRRQLALIEPLRALRLLHYSYWLARRWDDPAFPLAFPWFGTEKYWEEQILILREQQLRLNQPTLNLGP